MCYGDVIECWWIISQDANILFVDAPVGTGFSYATSAEAYAVSDTTTAVQVYTFLRKVNNALSLLH